LKKQHEVVEPNGTSALAVLFDTAEGWHFYADEKTAPGGLNLKLKPSAEKDFIVFSEPIFPKSHSYIDKSLNEKLEVFSDKFTVFLPFSVRKINLTENKPVNVPVKVVIEGAVCSDVQCRVPDFGQLSTDVKIGYEPTMGQALFILPEMTGQSKPVLPAAVAGYSIWFALGLAFLAGFSLNIMPCVWPVLPLVVLRIVEQAKIRTTSRLKMGLAFCIGILLFFVCLAAANIVLRISFGTTLQWGDQRPDVRYDIGNGPDYIGPVYVRCFQLHFTRLGIRQIRRRSRRNNWYGLPCRRAEYALQFRDTGCRLCMGAVATPAAGYRRDNGHRPRDVCAVRNPDLNPRPAR
jgi:hypothetical protein